MGILEIVNEIRVLLKSREVEALTDTGGHWPVSELLSRVNAAQDDIVEKTDCITALETVDAADSQREYQFGSTWMKILAVYYDDEPLKPTTINELDSAELYDGSETAWRTQEDSEPVAWYESDTAGYYGLYKTPSADDTGAIKVLHTVLPTQFTTDSTATTEPFNAISRFRPYHRMLVYKVVSECLEEDARTESDWAKIRALDNRYNQLMVRFMGITKYPAHTLPVIGQTSGGRAGFPTPYWTSAGVKRHD